ncbi:MAG: putative RNA methyltransferase [Ilumatobacteraceae bacterium]
MTARISTDGRIRSDTLRRVLPLFRCPHCAGSLLDHSSSLRCANGHSFDLAREGYVNLAPSGRLKGSISGDDEAMVRARRTVFDAGLYAPIIDEVAAVTASYAPSAVLDAGCGEGSYLAAITDVSGAHGWGIDISKAAIKLAARRHPMHRYAVASSYVLPFADATFDAVVNVFSPRDFAEMARVTAADGVAVVVTPGARHLAELKSTLYDDARDHDDPIERPDDVIDRTTVRFVVALPDPDLRLALLHMTPFWWSASTTRRDEIAASMTAVTVDMQLTVYRLAA